MKKIFFSFLSLISMACYAQSFGSGNIVVVRIGDGGAALVKAVAQPVFLDEYTPTGSLVRSIAMPTVTAGSNHMLTMPVSLSDYQEGCLSLSQDRQNLALAGYDAAPSTDTVALTYTTGASLVRRDVGIINAAGTVNTATDFTTYSRATIRSAVSNGTDIWTTGGNNGICYTTLNSTAVLTNITTTTLTSRNVKIFDGQLYASSTAAGMRMTTIGTNLPTRNGQPYINFTGYPTTATNPTIFEFFVADLNSDENCNDVLYVADSGYLRKYSKNQGTWIDNGKIGVPTDYYRGVTGRIENGNVILMATRKNNNYFNTGTVGGEIVSLIDNTGWNASFASLTPTIIATAPAYTIFRGVSFSPSTPAITLPVALTSFSGRYINNQIQLMWATASETNNSYFNIQHSIDGVNFSSIGRVKGAGNSAQAVNYTFNDQQPAAGKNYYRLEQVDFDGKSKLYSIILVNAQESKTAFRVIATPASNNVEMTFACNEGGKGTVSVTDMNGRTVAQKQVSFGQGTSNFFVECPELASGLYIAIFYVDNGLKLINKFIK